MANTSGKNRARGTARSAGAGMDDAPGLQENRRAPFPGMALDARQPSLALHMSLPGTRLDMLLGGPHPLLVELVRHLARTAARADHASAQPTSTNVDMTQENL